MSTKVRFAPSPTGLLHVGNARTALVNALFARAGGGHFLLRFDDTDRERSKDEYAAAIEEDLRWMGLAWDSSARQRDRLPAYEEAFARLRVADRVYPCWETPEELEYKRKRQLARGHPPIYDRAALRLTDGERRRLEEDGRRPHWRFMLQPGFVGWNDMVRGRVEMQADHMSDPVVVRADGTFLYMLPSAIDDIDLGITHVIRGEDHVANTAVQIQMFQALEAEPPAFAHLPKVADIAGKELSKRLGSMTVRSLRDDGIEPLALASYLARLGTGDPAQAAPSLAALAAEFDIARYGRATPKFDESPARPAQRPGVARECLGDGRTAAGRSGNDSRRRRFLAGGARQLEPAGGCASVARRLLWRDHAGDRRRNVRSNSGVAAAASAVGRVDLAGVDSGSAGHHGP